MHFIIYMSAEIALNRYRYGVKRILGILTLFHITATKFFMGTKYLLSLHIVFLFR